MVCQYQCTRSLVEIYCTSHVGMERVDNSWYGSINSRWGAERRAVIIWAGTTQLLSNLTADRLNKISLVATTSRYADEPRRTDYYYETGGTFASPWKQIDYQLDAYNRSKNRRDISPTASVRQLYVLNNSDKPLTLVEVEIMSCGKCPSIAHHSCVPLYWHEIIDYLLCDVDTVRLHTRPQTTFGIWYYLAICSVEYLPIL